jgi:hypothetical protein
MAVRTILPLRGRALPVLPKKFLDFSTLPVGGSQEVVLADRVELLHWRELTLKVRVHSHTMTGSNNVAIAVYPQSWTWEDPGIQWLTSGTSTFAVIDASTPSPGLVNLVVPTLSGAQPIAAMARLTAFAQRAGAGTMRATITLQFSTKIA